VDLFHPTNDDVNGGILRDLCSLKCIGVDLAIDQIRKFGYGTLLVKVDIKSAFRLLPVHPADHHLLSMRLDKHMTLVFHLGSDLLQVI